MRIEISNDQGKLVRELHTERPYYIFTADPVDKQGAMRLSGEFRKVDFLNLIATVFSFAKSELGMSAEDMIDVIKSSESDDTDDSDTPDVTIINIGDSNPKVDILKKVMLDAIRAGIPVDDVIKIMEGKG